MIEVVLICFFSTLVTPPAGWTIQRAEPVMRNGMPVLHVHLSAQVDPRDTFIVPTECTEGSAYPVPYARRPKAAR